MKNNKLWLRVLSLCLAVVCTFSIVAAATDLSGDGQTDVWDLQKAANENKDSTVLAEILEAALGGADELHKNENDQWEIHSALGLYNLAKRATEGESFILMKNIDLDGMDWTPIRGFKGTFDGNGYTISNVNITQDYRTNIYYAMGFFGSVGQYTKGEETVRSEVKNLHLENVNLVATENTTYMGLLAGTNKGVIENCTATGSITDNRTTLPKAVHVGALIGTNENTEIAGEVKKGTDLLTATAGSSNTADKVEGVSAKLATFFAEVSYPAETAEDKQYSRTLGGIAGWSRAGYVDDTMIWQDTSGSIAYKSQREQQLRQTVVDKMYQMGTVQWTPSKTVTFTKNGDSTLTHSNAFVVNHTYTGVPYVNGYNGSYERFLSQMETQDENGVYTTKDLENGTKDGEVVTGFVRYMGNNCSVAVGWAWAAVSSSRTDGGYGGVKGEGTAKMVPTVGNASAYGVLPAGGYTVLGEDADQKGRQTRQIIEANGGAAGMAEYYALASRGDALNFWQLDEGDTAADAHTRLLAYDPVIIRDYQTNIDLATSYVITHEQGDGLFDNRINDKQEYETYTDENNNTFKVKLTSWRIDHKYTLDVLLTEEAYTALYNAGYQSKETWPGCGWGYVPTTIAAFTAEKAKPHTYNAYTGENAPVLPSTGWYYSYYWNVSATMTISSDASGAGDVYKETAFLLDRNSDSEFDIIKLEQEFPNAYKALTSGQTYYITLTALAGDGTVTTILDNQAFTYTPAASAE